MATESTIAPGRDLSLQTFLPKTVSYQLSEQQVLQAQLKTASTESQLERLRLENASGFLLAYNAYLQDYTPISTLGDNNCAFNSIAIGIRDLLKLGRKIPENEGLLTTWNTMQKQNINWVAFCNHIKELNTYNVQKTLAPVLRRYAQDMLMAEQKLTLEGVRPDTSITKLQKHEFINNVIVEMNAYLCDQLQAKGYKIPNNPDSKPKKRFYSVTQEDNLLRKIHKEKWDALLTEALAAEQPNKIAFLQLEDAPSKQGKVPTRLENFLEGLYPNFLEYYKSEGHDREWQVKKTANNGLLWEGNEMQGLILRKLGINFHFLHHPMELACQSDCETDKGDTEAVGVIVAGFNGGHWTYYCDNRYLESLGYQAGDVAHQSRARGAQHHSNSSDVQIALWFLSFVAGLFIAIFATAPLVAAIASLGVPALAAAFAAQKFLFGLGSFVLFSLATRTAMWVTPKIITGLCILFKEEKVYVSASTSSHQSGSSGSTHTPPSGAMDPLVGGDDATPTEEDEANPSEQVTSQVKTGTDSSDISLAKPEEQATIAADPR